MADLDGERFQSLAKGFSGILLRPADEGYNEARKVHNGLIDKHPMLIARCRGVADVVDALGFARDGGMEVSIRGGGHNVSGRAVTEGGVMIDLSLMRGVHVDPRGSTLRAEGGVTWREFNREAALHGLATTGGAISTTGIAGLTLGGGLGWLMGKHGLAADNVLSAELVTAAGEVLAVSPEENADLFWAIRGGGGNFGVATSLEYRLHPLGQVVGGLVAHGFPAAREVLRFYRDFTQSVPDELTVFGALVHAPDGSGTPLAAFVICHAGSPQQAESDLSPLKAFGTPAMVEVGPMPYPVMNTLLDEGFPMGFLNYWKSNFVRSLDDGFIDAVVDAFAACPSPMTAIVFEHFHGAVTRIAPSDTPVPHRVPGYNFLIGSIWADPATTERNIAWTRDTYTVGQPYFAAGRWMNYLGDDEPTDGVRAAYGQNYARLAEIKRKYDPNNLFRLNQNIQPVAA